MIDEAGYRSNVGIVLVNRDGQVLLAKRIRRQSQWQFPQGGVDEGEFVDQALYRELKEELGLESQDIEVMAETKDWLRYEIPPKFRRYSEKPLCIGQKQKWFLLRLVAEDSQIRLDESESPEFDDWQWVDYWTPLDHVIAFKRDVYKQVLREFSSFV